MAGAVRYQRVGEQMAHALIEWLHMMYQKKTASKVLGALINKLEEAKEIFE